MLDGQIVQECCCGHSGRDRPSMEETPCCTVVLRSNPQSFASASTMSSIEHRVLPKAASKPIPPVHPLAQTPIVLPRVALLELDVREAVQSTGRILYLLTARLRL